MTPCLTANVGRALAQLGCPNCRQGTGYQLNGCRHICTLELLLFLAEGSGDLWPDGATDLCDTCIAVVRGKQIMHALPTESRELNGAESRRPRSPITRLTVAPPRHNAVAAQA